VECQDTKAHGDALAWKSMKTRLAAISPVVRQRSSGFPNGETAGVISVTLAQVLSA